VILEKNTILSNKGVIVFLHPYMMNDWLSDGRLKLSV
jgi:hypothetical protein